MRSSDEIRELIQMIEHSDVEEIEVTEWWWFRKIRVSKRAAIGALPSSTPAPRASLPSLEEADKKTEAKPSAEEAETGDLIPIKSPMVGTFYAAPAPDADSYVKVGDRVGKGTVVCIVEAMKLMNEIRSEAAGRVVKILVENGQPVEYGQTLFLLSPA
ncbi:MAG: acetyl-CoA carboxylase biotin carboxyl carrier protein [Candidatus Eisenbacteria bacterium]